MEPKGIFFGNWKKWSPACTYLYILRYRPEKNPTYAPSRDVVNEQRFLPHTQSMHKLISIASHLAEYCARSVLSILNLLITKLATNALIETAVSMI